MNDLLKLKIQILEKKIEKLIVFVSIMYQIKTGERKVSDSKVYEKINQFAWFLD